MAKIPLTESPTEELPAIFTAQSKRFFYCRDAVCEFVFQKGGVPLNPFRVFEYFLNDRVDRDLVRQGNNNLIRVSNELWVFGDVVANGVLFEILYAWSLGKPIRFHTIGTRSTEIRSIPPEVLRFEPELYRGGWSRQRLIDLVTGHEGPHMDRLFDPDAPEGQGLASVVELKRRA